MKRAGIRLFLAACAVLLVGIDAFGAQGALAEDASTPQAGVSPISPSVSLCSELPDGVIATESPLCQPSPGARVTFTKLDGSLLWSCEPTENPYCSVDVPYGGSVVVTLDESTIPDGYYLYAPENPIIFSAPSEPMDDLVGGPFFILLPIDDVAPEQPGEATEDSEGVPTGEAQEPVVDGHSVVLYAGDCDNLGEEVATLSGVLPETGDPVGDEKAIPAEMSVTIGAAFSLDQAIDDGLALVVYEGTTTAAPAACGELGGVNTGDGVLPIGLGQVDDSGIVGTAIFSYNDDDALTTDVTIVISAGLIPEPAATPNA